MMRINSVKKSTKVIILSVLGFILTGVFLYPYGTFWDSARAFTYILTEGHANVDNWLGWYFPLLWEGLYRITGIQNILGTWIILLYWISVTILYLNLFDAEKRSLWWYAAFAWFPGSLMFVLNITNNALMMVMLMLGLAFLSVFANKRKLWWIVLSIITLIQCSFIRRESFVIVLPLVFIILLAVFLANRKKLTAFMYASITSIAIFIGLFGTEKAITSRITNYDYMDALSITCLHDMTAVTYQTERMCIPTHLLKTEYSDSKDCFEHLLKIENGQDSIWNGDVMIHRIKPFLDIEDRYMLRLPKQDVISFYSHNLIPWLKFRARYALNYFWYRQQMCYTTIQDNEMILYSPPTPTITQRVVSYAVPIVFGSVQIFYYLSLFVLLFDWKKRIKYKSRGERIVILSLVGVSFIETVLVMFTSIAIQYRYLYPVCVIQYLVFIYVLSRLKYKEIAQKMSLIEE